MGRPKKFVSNTVKRVAKIKPAITFSKVLLQNNSFIGHKTGNIYRPGSRVTFKMADSTIFDGIVDSNLQVNGIPLENLLSNI